MFMERVIPVAYKGDNEADPSSFAQLCSLGLLSHSPWLSCPLIVCVAQACSVTLPGLVEGSLFMETAKFARGGLL